MGEVYHCGTCGDGGLVMRAIADEHGEWVWAVTCGNGHELWPVPGEEYRVIELKVVAP